MLDVIFEWIFNEKIVRTILISIGLVVLYIILKNLVDKILNIRHKSLNIDIKKVNTLKSLFINIIKYVLIFIGIIVVLSAFGLNTTTLLAGLGVIGAVVGLALQDILKDFFAGIFIIVENQFQVGDTVEIGGFKGEVISLGFKTTRIKKYTGEIMIISNRTIDYIVNFSKDNSLEMIDIDVAYEEDLDKVQKVLENLCEKLSEIVPDLKQNIEVLGVEKLDDSSVTFRISVVTEAMKHFAAKRLILKEVKKEFDKNNIKIPYPQVEVHNGKRV